ncbi:MAG TPA: DUF559 domain-containing protein [Chitinophagales bacterium]|nr:DUF559 domain-containing protein [Chitinophagales bacterium]
MRRKIIPYNPRLKQLARNLRNNSTQSEIILWKLLSNRKMLGYDFHRQKPIDNYILDFFCHELMLGIELDGISHWNEDTANKDAAKEKRLNDLGVHVMRFTDTQVIEDSVNVLRAIEGWIEEKTTK